MKKFLIVLAMVLFFFPTVSETITFTPTGVTVVASYVEPTTNNDGSVLTDLGKTTIYYQIVGSPTPVNAKEIPATATTGGGTVVSSFDIPIIAGQEANVDCWSTATDLNGNESVKSEIVRIRIDRLAPAPPK